MSPLTLSSHPNPSSPPLPAPSIADCDVFFRQQMTLVAWGTPLPTAVGMGCVCEWGVLLPTAHGHLGCTWDST